MEQKVWVLRPKIFMYIPGLTRKDSYSSPVGENQFWLLHTSLFGKLRSCITSWSDWAVRAVARLVATCIVCGLSVSREPGLSGTWSMWLSSESMSESAWESSPVCKAKIFIYKFFYVSNFLHNIWLGKKKMSCFRKPYQPYFLGAYSNFFGTTENFFYF